ncbi:hypothetical protein FGO68_gene7578 [Halteria grandinella]|uniref:Uncharacterized protein n=1 Tax=Halteria grandinella TaxID=5974 RepID=A0A8J8SVZ3_HALGN|nr:hypothetical protein FGO68_gene7578 [Halteria grandinella]
MQNMMRNSGTIIPFPERILDEFTNGRGSNHKIVEEDENEDDTGNVSETMSLAGSQVPTPHLRMANSDNKMIFSQSTLTGGHTRTNSSKAQSLKGSIVIQKPAAMSSQFSSIVLQNNSQHHDKKKPNAINVPETKKVINRNTNNIRIHPPADHAMLLADIDQFLSQVPASFVCTGGTEFHNEHTTAVVSSAIRLSNHQKEHQTPESHIKVFSAQKSDKTLARHSTESEKFGKQDEETKSSFPFSPQNLNEDSSMHSPPPGNFDDSSKSGGKYVKDWIAEEDQSKKGRFSGQQQKSVMEKIKPPALRRNFSPIKSGKQVKGSVAQSRFTAELTKKRFK